MYYVVEIARECGEYESPMVCLCISPYEDDAADAIAFSIEYYKEVPDEVEKQFAAMVAALNTPLRYLYLWAESAEMWVMDTPPTLRDMDCVEEGLLDIYPLRGEFLSGMQKGKHYQDDEGRPYSYIRGK